MKFNLCYLGSDNILSLRRDFILAMLYSLRDLGHDVILSGSTIDPGRFNLIQGGHLLNAETARKLHASGARFAHINTEIVSNGKVNHDALKTDFNGAYLPSLRQGTFVWDVVMDNLDELGKHQVNAHFLRWGWHPKLQDIEHLPDKDLDFYFFGTMTPRRVDILKKLQAAGLTGAADGQCPYFIRNDRISRAKVQINIIQDDRYTHVNSFRICYLANNACCIVSEPETDPASYLDYTFLSRNDDLPEAVRRLSSDGWKQQGEHTLEAFRKIRMRDTMEALLDASFGASRN
jgi:hypothetical protein